MGEDFSSVNSNISGELIVKGDNNTIYYVQSNELKSNFITDNKDLLINTLN